MYIYGLEDRIMGSDTKIGAEMDEEGGKRYQ